MTDSEIKSLKKRVRDLEYSSYALTFCVTQMAMQTARGISSPSFLNVLAIALKDSEFATDLFKNKEDRKEFLRNLESLSGIFTALDKSVRPSLESQAKKTAQQWRVEMRKAASKVLNSKFEIMVVGVEEEES
ncbi:MAG: hypothetical protein F4Z21_12420 [Acidobacteria bacterium]|nr:hypothetical protein [Acidobacteriota bacterium]